MSGVPVARLLGFEIRVHLSWAIILAVIAVTVAAQIGEVAPSIAPALRWVVGGIVAAAFLGSALLHELGHALVARRVGLGGGTVVVYFFGGTATPGIEARRPRDEVAVGLAGPAVSLVLGAALVLAAVVADALGPGTAAVAQVLLVVGVLNLVLGGINLLPAFPLDGGRVAQGLAWARTGDPSRALHVAARSGRLVGWSLAGLGLAVVVLVDTIDGLMLGLIGWFLAGASRQVDQRATFDELLEDARVADAMDHDVPRIAAGLTIDTFAGPLLDGSVASSLPVLRDRELVGLVSARQVRGVARKRWTELRAEDLMSALAEVPRVAPDTPLRSAFDELRRTGLDGLPVFDAEELTGIVTRRGVLEALRSRARLRDVPLP